MMSFSWFDLVLILLVLLSAWGGWRRGFILSALDLVRWVVSFLAGLFFYRTVAGWVAYVSELSEVWSQPIAFLLIFIFASFLIQITGSSLLSRIPRETHESQSNRFFGILPGLINGVVTAALISALLLSLPLSEGFSESLRQSYLASRLAAYTDELETVLAPIFEEPLRQTLNRRTTPEPGSAESAELPFRVQNARPRPDLEAEMLELINRERTANGLSTLQPDPEMTEVARAHSADMFARGFFSHNTPEGRDPFDRIRDAKIRFRTAGENLALAPTLQIAHTGLMNSPGHRANILHRSFGRVGIGILDGGRWGLMVSQEFRD